MAKRAAKKMGSTGTVRKRRRRSPEQIIADLQDEIKRVKAKAVARELKQSPAVKSAVTALRALDKGLDHAAEESNPRLRHALADARKVLGAELENLGMRLPKANMPKGPKPK